MKAFLIVIMAGFMLAFSSEDLVQDESVNGHEVTLVIDLKESLPVKKDVFGINGNMSNGTGDYDDLEFIRLFVKLGAPNIRFPGGTVSNLYDWETGGFVINPKGNARHNRMVPRKNALLEKKKKHYDTETFLKCIRESDASFSIVLNMMKTPESSRKWMQLIKDQGERVSRVELGNELYFIGNINLYPDPLDYVKAARAHSLAIKKVFPDCKIGIVVSSLPYTHEDFFSAQVRLNSRYEKRAMAWDAAIMTADFYDALVIHMYARCGIDGSPVELHPDLDILKAYKLALSYNDQMYPKVISYLKKRHPAKDIWITEYNIKTTTITRGFTLSESYLGRLFTADFLVKLFSTPEVTSANWHNLNKFIDNKNGFSIAGAFDFMQIFDEPVDTCNKISKMRVDNLSFEAQQSLAIRGLFFHSDQSGYLIIVNRLETPYIINGLKIKGRNIKPLAMITITPDEGGSAGFSSLKHRKSQRKINSFTKLRLAPFSINRIKIQLDQI